METTGNHQGPNAIFQMLNAAQATAVLCSSIELNVFAILSGGALDAEAVAGKINCPARSTRILLEALTVIGLATKDGGKYRLTPMAEEHLVPGRQMYVGDMSGILGSPMMWTGLSRMAEAVRNDGSILSEHAETPSAPFWETFAKSSGSMAMGASLALEAQLHDWTAKRGTKVRVLDVAAGSGIYGYAFVQKNPNVELTTLDWPNVIAESKQWARKLNVDSRRVRYLEGSLFDVDYGGPYDLILMSHIYHHFDAQTCMSLTHKVAKALAPGGRVAIHEFLSDSEHPGGKMFSLTMLVWSQKGETYGEKDYRAWLAEAGLKTVNAHVAPGMPTGIVIGEKGMS